MDIIAKTENIRVGPRKLRLVADAIRKMAPQDAVTKLGFLPKSASKPMMEVLKAALANAQHNFKKNVSDLKIKSIWVNEGLKMKRQDKSHNNKQPGVIQKRTSHITITLEG